MPKYSVSGKYSLKDTLKAMGVVTAFSPTADFSGMTTEQAVLGKVCIRNAIHYSRWCALLIYY